MKWEAGARERSREPKSHPTILLTATAEDHHIARMAALALGLSVLEAAIPSPLPGVKPGLANIVTLIVLARYGWRAAAWVSLLRVVAGSLLMGNFLAPGFFLSLSGALCSLAVLAVRPAPAAALVRPGHAQHPRRLTPTLPGNCWWFISGSSRMRASPTCFPSSRLPRWCSALNGLIAAHFLANKTHLSQKHAGKGTRTTNKTLSHRVHREHRDESPNVFPL